MACSCHGKSGENIQNRRMPPDSQCLMCAMKHVGMAMEAIGELTYERDNRDFALNHLRLAIEHTKLDWRDVAVKMRDATVMLDLVQDTKPGQLHGVLKGILDELHRLYDVEHPEQAKKLKELRDAVKVDVIIPLGPGSSHDNDELRILLRSIDRHCSDVGRVIIATDCLPAWVDMDKVTVVEAHDTEPRNKDCNIEMKVLKSITECNVERFVFCADDNVFLQDVELKHIPLLHNRRRSDFTNGDTKWRRRVLHTFDYFLEKGVPLEYEYESHAPQYFDDARGLVKAMEGIDIKTQPGLTIMTAFRACRGEIYGSVHKNGYKETYEMPCTPKDFHGVKMFAGFNDIGFAGIRDRLFEIYPEKGRYER